MKKIRMIRMISGLIPGFVGRAWHRNAPWQSLIYHVTSSVLAEGCHFSLIRDVRGSMTITGYCFSGGSEHRLEEARAVSPETLEAILALELEKASTKRQKLLGIADGTKKTVMLGYPDGTQRRIRLSPQQQKQLKQLLQKELVGL